MLPTPYRTPSSRVPVVLRHGSRIVSGPLELRMMKSDDMNFRAAVLVGVSVDKRATVRNRMKRLVRESVYRLLPRLTGGIDAVIRVRSRLPDFEHDVEVSVANLLRHAGILDARS